MTPYADMLTHLESIEWGGEATIHYKCPSCGAARVYGHAKDCALSVLIQKCRHEVKRQG